MKLSDTIQRVIELSQLMRAYWDRELPKRLKDYPWIRAGEDRGPPPPEEAELRTLLKELTHEELYTVMAVMYVGRGDVAPFEIPTLRDNLKKRFPMPARAIDQIVAKGVLSDYLIKGINAVYKSHYDLEESQLATR